MAKRLIEESAKVVVANLNTREAECITAAIDDSTIVVITDM